MQNLFSLEGKVALVTGAAYGIGFAMAEALAKAGAEIAFNCRGQEHMDKALADYEAKGIKAHGYICDVTNEADVQKMVADIRKELGHIDILVNNAGIIKRIPMHEMTREEFQQVIDIDLVGPFIMTKAVIPEMIERREGKIIAQNMVSITSSAMPLVLATSPRPRLLRSVSVRPMAAVIRSTRLSVPRPLQVAGSILRN